VKFETKRVEPKVEHKPIESKLEHKPIEPKAEQKTQPANYTNYAFNDTKTEKPERGDSADYERRTVQKSDHSGENHDWDKVDVHQTEVVEETKQEPISAEKPDNINTNNISNRHEEEANQQIPVGNTQEVRDERVHTSQHVNDESGDKYNEPNDNNVEDLQKEGLNHESQNYINEIIQNKLTQNENKEEVSVAEQHDSKHVESEQRYEESHHISHHEEKLEQSNHQEEEIKEQKGHEDNLIKDDGAEDKGIINRENNAVESVKKEEENEYKEDMGHQELAHDDKEEPYQDSHDDNKLDDLLELNNSNTERRSNRFASKKEIFKFS
jgi:hypothetical protein